MLYCIQYICPTYETEAILPMNQQALLNKRQFKKGQCHKMIDPQSLHYRNPILGFFIHKIIAQKIIFEIKDQTDF